MQRPFQTLALLCALLTFAAASHAKDDGHNKDRAFIKAAYAAADQAVHRKNADAAVSCLTGNYTAVDAAGKTLCRSKKEQRADFQKMFSNASTVSSRSAIQGIVFTKAGATVTTTDETAYTLARDGQTTIGDQSKSRDFWIQSGGKWLLQRSVFTANDEYVQQASAR